MSRCKINPERRRLLAGLGLGLALTLPLGLSVAAAQQAEPAPGSRRRRIIAFGDSLTAGYGLLADEAFPAQLQAALKTRGLDVEVINAGLSGDTTGGGLDRLDWTLEDGADLVLVALGANDALRGLPLDIAESNLTRIVQGIKARGMRVLLIGLRGPGAESDVSVSEGDALFARIAEAEDVPLHPDFFNGIWGQSQLFQADRLHPNRAGVAKMVEGILPAVEAALP